jgi:hypothetical protein
MDSIMTAISRGTLQRSLLKLAELDRVLEDSVAREVASGSRRSSG